MVPGCRLGFDRLPGALIRHLQKDHEKGDSLSALPPGSLPVNFLDGAYLVNPGQEPYGLSGRCTHLGCTVHFDPVSAQFKCPCHGSRFDRSGRRVAGPATKDLERVPVVEKENGDLSVILTF